MVCFKLWCHTYFMHRCVHVCYFSASKPTSAASTNPKMTSLFDDISDDDDDDDDGGDLFSSAQPKPVISQKTPQPPQQAAPQAASPQLAPSTPEQPRDAVPKKKVGITRR